MKIAPTTSKKNLAERLGLSSEKPKYRYRLIDFKNELHKTDLLLSQTNCHLEILPDGIMVIGNFPGRDTIIPILKSEVDSIRIVRGKEVVDTFHFSPMHVLSKLGMPNRITRHLSLFPWEYTITETLISITCQEYQLKLTTSGNRYDKLVRRFKNSGYVEELDSIDTPIFNALDYSA